MLSLSSAFLVFAPKFPGLFGLSVFSAILMGMRSALLYLCCAHVYSQTPLRKSKSMLYALFSLFLAVAIYFMVYYGSPPIIGKIAFCLMPIFAVLLLPISTKERLFPQKENGRVPLRRAAWRFAASIALIINIGVGYLQMMASYLALIAALVVVLTLVFPERVMKRLVVVDPSDLAVFGSDSGGKVRPWKEKCLTFASDIGLTLREHEVFMLIACAKTNDFIAQELTISSLTVKTHRQNIYAKMGVHSAQELIDTIEKF